LPLPATVPRWTRSPPAALAQRTGACRLVRRFRWAAWWPLRAALLAPQRVTALCLLATSPSFVARHGWPHAMPADALTAFAAGLDTNAADTLARFDALQTRGSTTARADLRRLRQWRASGTPAALRDGLQALQDADLRADVRRLSCPSIWIFGANDALVPVAVAAQTGAAHSVVLEHTNHLVGLNAAANPAAMTALVAELKHLIPEAP
jgi:pimeloyl-ACP methyl ester carboxylesterase